MPPRSVTLATYGLVSLTLALSLLATVLTLLSWSTPPGDDLPPPEGALSFVFAAISFSAVGAVLAFKRSKNPIGWLFLVSGAFTALDVAHGRYLLYTVVTEPSSSLPDLIATGGLVNTLWIVTMACTVIVLMTFPEGRFTSRRWAIAAVGMTALAGLALGMILIEPGPLVPPFEDENNRLGIEAYEDFSFLFSFVILSIALVALAAAVTLFRRFRRATGDEREQLKWFAYVAAWLPPLTIAYVIANIFGELEGTVFVTLSLATGVIISALPMAIGIAVLKYRLYEIDIIVNRTLVYVPLTAILAGLFTAVTNLLRALFTDVSGFGSDSAVAISTLSVVALFTPVRTKLQTIVDRYFRDAEDPSKPLRALAREARTVLNVLDTRALMQDFVDKATLALDAQGAALYVVGKEEPLLTSGTVGGSYALTFPLHQAEVPIGELNVTPSRTGRPYTADQVAVLDAESDVLARTLVLHVTSAATQDKNPGLLTEDPDPSSLPLEDAVAPSP